MTAATFGLIKARRKEPMKHEDYNDSMRRLAGRADGECRQLEAAIDHAAEIIRKTSDFLDGTGDILQPGELSGKDRRPVDPDGERPAVERSSDDVCGMEHEVRATATRDELGRRSHGYSGDGYRPGARAIKSAAWDNY